MAEAHVSCLCRLTVVTTYINVQLQHRACLSAATLPAVMTMDSLPETVSKPLIKHFLLLIALVMVSLPNTTKGVKTAVDFSEFTLKSQREACWLRLQRFFPQDEM